MADSLPYSDVGEDRSSRKYIIRKKKSACKIICSQLFSVLLFAAGVVAGLLIGIYAYHGGPNSTFDKDSNGNAKSVKTQTEKPETTSSPYTSTSARKTTRESNRHCKNRNPIEHLNYEESIYAPLTTNEMDRIATYMNDRGLVTTQEPPSSLTENFILFQVLHPPVKAEALHYLDNGGEKPGRYAKVTVQRGNRNPPDIMEYKVGPLGSSGPLTHAELVNAGDIHFNSRPYDQLEFSHMTSLIGEDLNVLEPLIRESFDNSVYPDDMNIIFNNGPPNRRGAERETR